MSGPLPSGATVLIVEDDYFVGLMLEDAIAGAGHAVLGPVATAEEGLELALAHRPNLVLMDVRLAGELDGVDAAIALHRHAIPTIFVTAHSDPDTKQRGEQAAPLGWIEKPFSGAELLKAVGTALS